MSNKPQKQYLYKLKKDALTLKDMRIMWSIRSGEANDKEIVEWLDTVVEGGVENVPMNSFGKLYEEIFEQFYDIDDPKDNEGKASNSV